MSWRKIQRPQALPRGAEHHRREAAQKLVDWYTGGQSRGDLGHRLDFLTGQSDRDVQTMIQDVGSVKEVARVTGASERTVRDWRSGKHSPSSRHHESLERAARRATVQHMGGTKTVAALTGRSATTVRTWVRKRTTAKGDAVHRLNKAEVQQRHQRARQQQNVDPASPLVFKATGHVRVRTTTPTPPYDADRSVRHEIDESTQRDIDDAVARGDVDAVQKIFENALTDDYAGLGTDLYNGDDLGFFLDRIDGAEMEGDPDNR